MAMIIHLLGAKETNEFPPEVFALKEDELYIGRLPSCKITMNDDSISRLHARIYKQDGHWWIEDIRSRNGIFINGRSVSNAKLVEGDIITTGDVHFTLNNRRVDQIEHIQDWVEERIQDAIGYREDISNMNTFDISQKESGRIPPITDPTSYQAQITAPTPEPSIQPQQPVIQPQQPVIQPQQPVIQPQQATIKPAAPFQAPGSSFQSPSASSSSSRKPVAQNVMGNDTIVIVIITISVILLIIGLAWRFRDVFMPASSF